VLVLPVSGLSAILLTRLVVSESGTSVYGLFALVAAIPFLIPISDLGLGAAVTNAAAGLPEDLDSFRSTLSRVCRVLCAVAVIVIIVDFGLAVAGVWSRVFRVSDGSADWAIFAAVAIFATSIPASVGARMLLGMRRNADVVFIQGLTSSVTLGCVWIAHLSGLGHWYFIGLSTIGMPVTAWFMFGIAMARMKQGQVRTAEGGVGASVGRHRVADGSSAAAAISSERNENSMIAQTAIPMIVISLALPLTFQTDRMVLGSIRDLNEVAVYSAAALVFLPTLSVVQMAGRSLWGDFARARNRLEGVAELYKRALILCLVVGAVGAVGFVVLAPYISGWATDRKVETPLLLFICFGALLVVQAVQQPSGMYLTDVWGLRFQACTTTCAAAFSIPCSIVGASEFGAVGPVIASVVAVAVFHTLPCTIAAWRRSMAPPAEPLAGSERRIAGESHLGKATELAKGN
jgi:O-antigen/teichoic acid export membrane protein